MWDRLITIKQHRETRLRRDISATQQEIHLLVEQVEQLQAQRTEVLRTWQERSQEQSIRSEEELGDFRRELSGYASEEIRLKKERLRLRTQVVGLKQRIYEWNIQLRQCLMKQEKLRLLRDEMGDSHAISG